MEVNIDLLQLHVYLCSTYSVKCTSQACVPAWERDPIHTFPVGLRAEILWAPGVKEEETREEHGLEKQYLFQMQKQAKGLPWARSATTGATGGRLGKEHRSRSNVMRKSGLRPGTMALMLSQPALESEESEAVSRLLFGLP